MKTRFPDSTFTVKPFAPSKAVDITSPEKTACISAPVGAPISMPPWYELAPPVGAFLYP